jgi:hypothetical protein
MKKLILTIAMVAGLALVGLTGCKKSEAPATQKVDTTQVEAAFASAQGNQKTLVDKAVAAIKAGDYPAAIASLKSAMASGRIAPEQQDVLNATIKQLESKINEALGEAGKAAEKAGTDLKNAISK